MDDLGEISNVDLINLIKDNPNDSSYLAELQYRFTIGDMSDKDFIKAFDVIIKAPTVESVNVLQHFFKSGGG